MPRYAILAEHTPDTCPSSNAKVRARAAEGMGQQMPDLAKKAGIRFELEPQHLDPGHRTVAIVEASNIESVTQLVFDTGLSQWNTVEVCPLTPVVELMSRVNDFPILYS